MCVLPGLLSQDSPHGSRTNGLSRTKCKEVGETWFWIQTGLGWDSNSATDKLSDLGQISSIFIRSQFPQVISESGCEEYMERWMGNPLA